MKKIKLTQHKYALVDNDDFKRVNSHRWYANYNGRYWYAARHAVVNGKWVTQRMHQFIINVPKKLTIDHKNHDSLDNRKSNLRICTTSENGMNQQPQQRKTSSRFKGVHWHKRARKWMAQMMLNRKHVYLGLHTNEIKAAKAYDEKAKELFGDFAYLNFR